MTTSIIIFACACAGMMLMILVKLHELKTGREFILVRWRTKIDRYAHVSFSRARVFVAEKEHKAVFFLKGLPARALNLVSSFNDFLHKRYGKHIDMIKGRSVPTNKGSVSFFVSSISEYKKEIKQ